MTEQSGESSGQHNSQRGEQRRFPDNRFRGIPSGTEPTIEHYEYQRYGTDVLGGEKMAPVIAAYRYQDLDDAIRIAAENLEKDGKGHSVSFHTNSEEHIAKVAESLCVSRFVINQCSSNSAGGSYFNGLNPTNTLGCGSWGHNSISENLNYTHLMNVSRVARFMPDNYVPSEEELWGE